MDKIISVKNITKKFKNFVATNNISIDFKKGETVAIIGDNGAGKTTFVSQVAGVLPQTSGTIDYFFTNGSKNPKEQIGVQFQANAFPKGLKVKHLIEFFQKTAGEKIDLAKLKEHFEAFEIEEIMDKEANSLSGGQKQRLNIVIALLSDPEVLILDEMSTGLDIGVRYRMLKYIDQLKKVDKKTLIIISHSVDEIDILADRVILLEKGSIVDDKTIEQIRKENGDLSTYLSKYFTGGAL